MQFTTIIALAFAATAYALPVDDNSTATREASVSLPSGCTEANLVKCALHLVGTTASCGAAVIEAGLNPAADLACIGSAASTANNFSECKSCIPSSTKVIET
ncbi:hypothetical protein BDV97DRAFT_395104 [Delphinella strobiligena]|nr:hypothetical protein BDV97DRAFT_395104 [Delphinella strobiligena]